MKNSIIDAVPIKTFWTIQKAILNRFVVWATLPSFKGKRLKMARLMFIGFYDDTSRREIIMDKPLMVIGAVMAVLGLYLMVDGIVYYKALTTHLIIDGLIVLIGFAVIRLSFKYAKKDSIYNEQNFQGFKGEKKEETKQEV